MKYYVVTFLGESIDNGAYCNVCCIYTDLKVAKQKMQFVIKEEEKRLILNNILYKIEDNGCKVVIRAVDGNWTSTIELHIVDKEEV